MWQCSAIGQGGFIKSLSSSHWTVLSKIQVTEGEVTNDEQNETPVGLPRCTFRTEKTTLEAAQV